jgi:hypothetical protein
VVVFTIFRLNFSADLTIFIPFYCSIMIGKGLLWHFHGSFDSDVVFCYHLFYEDFANNNSIAGT